MQLLDTLGVCLAEASLVRCVDWLWGFAFKLSHVLFEFDWLEGLLAEGGGRVRDLILAERLLFFFSQTQALLDLLSLGSFLRAGVVNHRVVGDVGRF